MADADINSMLVRIEATTAGMRRELDLGDSRIKKFSDNTNRAGESVDGVFEGMGKAVAKLLGPLAGAISAFETLKKAVEVQRQFDVLNAGLITATGSTEKAAVAFGALQKFAATTPYSLDQAVEGFTKLVNLGLTPSEAALTSYGNTASAMGKDLNQMIEAVADAATGEFERLKEFGITSSQQGDKVSLTFRGVTTTIGKNAKEIEGYLLKLGQVEFAGAMDQRAKTLDGAISNLGDTWDATFRLINERGLGELMKDAVDIAADALQRLNDSLASGEFEGYLEAIGGKFSGFSADVVESLQILDAQFGEFFSSLGPQAESTTAFLVGAFRDFPENVRAFIQLMTVEVLAGFDQAQAYAIAFKDGVKAIFTSDTLEGVGARLEQTLNGINQARQGSIEQILNERDAVQKSYREQTSAADERLRKYREERAQALATGGDVLAQFGKQASATNANTAASKALEAQKKKEAKALADLKAQVDIAIRSATGLADAYLAGKDKSREFTIQQKVEEELLKTGAGVRKEVEKAIRGQADAEDRLAISKQAYDLNKDAADQLALAKATLQGADALQAYNVQKAMQVALAGKNVESGSKEYEQLLAATKAQQDAIKIAQQASSVGGIMDRLYPEQKLLRDYTNEQDALNAAMKLYPERSDDYRSALQRLGVEYEQNRRAATAWGQFTEGAVDRIDGAFADMWKSVLGKSGNFMDSLKDSFRQFLAEMAHMAITKPIIVQIAASLGIGSAAVQSAGVLSSAGGGGGFGAGSLLNGASSLYSAATGWGKALYTGFQSGGLSGAWTGLTDYTSGVLASWDQAAGQLFGNITNGAGMTYAPLSAQPGALGSIGNAVPWAAGIGGALYGYSQSGLKGAATGAAGGIGGAMLGQALIPIPILGAAIGGALGSYIGGSLFGGSWQTKDQGLSLGVEDGDLSAMQFEYQKKKGGLFGSNKKRTRYSALDDDTQKALDDSYEATTGAVFDLFDRLNVELNDGVLDGLNVAATQISTKGKTAEQIQEEIAKWFSGVADSVTEAINTATGSGLDGYNFEALTTFVNNLYGVNDIFTALNFKLYDTSVAGGKLAESLSAYAGGLANLQAITSAYYDNFYTDTEKADNVLEAVRKQFSDIDIAFPNSREGFRAMIEGIDRTTVAGQQLFVTLTALAGNAASAYTILEQRAAASTQALFDGASSSFSVLQRAINAQKATVNESLSTATTSVGDLTTVSNSLSTALKALRGDSADTVKMLRSQAQATLQAALAQARSGKSLADFVGLDDALSTVSENNTDLYSSLEDFNRDQGRTANVVAELQKLNGKQLSSAQQTVKALQDQLTRLDKQLDFAQSQLDALNGVDNSVKTVADAVKQMNASVVAAMAGLSGGKSLTPGNSGVFVDTAYQSVFGAGYQADAAGRAYWQQQLASGAISLDQLEQAIRNAAIANGSIKAHASGGLITGPGTGTSDSILSRLSNGEFVMRAAAVNAYGADFMSQLNNLQIPAFAAGGPIVSIPKLGQAKPAGSSSNDAVSQKLDRLAGLLQQILGPLGDIKDDSQKGRKMLDKWDRLSVPVTSGA
ncbi:tape measure protein [Pseudomonas sp. NPDC090202]|uniref:tape measure protein n=1 Tax=Pseudomonas sp. NPDC090202 TaxID=3364476 RepID=UPI003813B3C8